MQARILIVDDGRTALKKRLTWMGHEVLTAEDGEQGLKLVTEEQPDLMGRMCSSKYSFMRRLERIQDERDAAPHPRSASSAASAVAHELGEKRCPTDIPRGLVSASDGGEGLTVVVRRDSESRLFRERPPTPRWTPNVDEAPRLARLVSAPTVS